MTGYVIAINNIGAVLTTAISSLYPVLAMILSIIILKEKVGKIQLFGICLCIIGMFLLSFTNKEKIIFNNIYLGVIGAIICCIGWGLESIIVGYGMKEEKITDEQILTIRQITSAICYAILVIKFLVEGNQVIDIINSKIYLIILASICGTISYLFYYKSIEKIGVSKALPLNITYVIWSIFFSYILLNNKIEITNILIICLIIVGIIISEKNKNFE